jgi:hypothetical protein
MVLEGMFEFDPQIAKMFEKFILKSSWYLIVAI